MSAEHTSIIEFVKEQLAIDPKDSKKFVAMQFGIISVLVVAATAGLIFFLGPVAVAGSVAMVAQIAITAIGGLVATYITGQAATEWKANTVLNTSAQTFAPAALPPENPEPLPVVVTNPGNDPVPVVGTPVEGSVVSLEPGAGGAAGNTPVSTKPFGAAATKE